MSLPVSPRWIFHRGHSTLIIYYCKYSEGQERDNFLEAFLGIGKLEWVKQPIAVAMNTSTFADVGFRIWKMVDVLVRVCRQERRSD